MLEEMRRWRPPERWARITTVDAHTAGEPFRVVTGGYPEPVGDTMLERRRYARDHLDHLRTALMWEPRGHADMYGCVVTPPVSPEADIGVLFLHNEGYSTMCGHGIIGIATVALETGLLPITEPETTVRIDTPAGLVTAVAHVAGGRVRRVRFRNVPSFVVALDAEVEVPGLGRIVYDLAFGGAFYAFVPASSMGLTCTPEDFDRIIELGMAVKRAVMAARSVPHPFEEDLSFLYGTIFVGPPLGEGAHSRNVCVFAEGEVDRCPTGTGVSARLALHHARGEIGVGQAMVVESILGTRFTGRILEVSTFGPHEAVVPELEGAAYITGRHDFLLDPNDPLRHGFILR
jgi:proline racemase